MSPVTVRRASAADLPALGELGADLMRAHHAFDPDRFLAPGGDPAPAYAAFLQSQLATTTSAVIVADRAGDLVGYVYAAIEPHSWQELRDRAGFIHDLVVADRARGAGIATALVQAATAWLHDQGVPRVLLWTAAPNEPARRLFAKLGFRPTMIEMTRERE